MRPKLVVGVIAFFLLVGVVLLGALFGPSLLNEKGVESTGFDGNQSQAAGTADNAIIQENAKLGTITWEIPAERAATIQIQAYADANSVLPGQKITLYVSTLKQATAYSIDIYRLGWYGSYGGRLILSVPNQSGQQQGYYDDTTHRLVGCLTCHVDTSTGLVEAKWQPSYALTVPLIGQQESTWPNLLT
jgi:hypothetical protein